MKHWIGIAFALASVAGCREPSRCIDVGKPMELMARPNYAETQVVDTIRPGRHRYTSLSYDKNYGWYEVRGERGRVGYLIVDPMAVRVDCSEPYRDPRLRPRRSTIPWADSAGEP